MSTIVKFNNKILRLNNKTVGWTAPVPPPVLYHVTTNGVNGTVVATPNTGYNGDTITLSNTPDEGYEFDSYSLTGATLYDTNKFDIDNSDVNVVGNFIINYNPLNLPPNTVRVRTSDGNRPSGSYTTYESATLVAGTTDIYDIYKSGTDFTALLYNSNNTIEVLGANTTGITIMHDMFSNCSSLISVALFDTSNVSDMSRMFVGCTSLTSVPRFDTSNVSNMSDMFDLCYALTNIPLFDTSNVSYMYRTFYCCYKVQSGALALYQQASSQATPPSNHTQTFYRCGRDTETGAAELAQIPDDWK